MIHILFSSSAAGTLRQVLRSRGQREKVVDLTDALDWGPIADGDFKAREQWFATHVPAEPETWDWLNEHAKEFCGEIDIDTNHLIWMAPRSAHEQSGFYWYLNQFSGNKVRVIVADYPLGASGTRGEAPERLGILDVNAMTELLDEAPRLPWDRERFPESTWNSLIHDNALLRIVEKGKLRSASESYFDHFLLNRCSSEWADQYLTIGYTMSDIFDAGYDASDAFLLWRMRELVNIGDLACDGELRWGKAKERARVRATGRSAR